MEERRGGRNPQAGREEPECQYANGHNPEDECEDGCGPEGRSVAAGWRDAADLGPWLGTQEQSRKGTRSDVESYSLAPKAQETKQLASIALAPPSPAEASTNLAPVFLSDTESSTSKNSKNKDRKKKEKKKSERKAVNKAEQNNTANTVEEDGVKTANLISDGKEETQGVKTAENFSDGESIDIKTAKGIE